MHLLGISHVAGGVADHDEVPCSLLALFALEVQGESTVDMIELGDTEARILFFSFSNACSSGTLPAHAIAQP